MSAAEFRPSKLTSNKAAKHTDEEYMTEFVVRLADERGKVQEQTHAAATADELRA